jgi:hypothetical protein
MMDESPFTLDRFENDRDHLYYLPQKVFQTLQSAKSTYLIGSRGTGKTTFLQALSCVEQLSNLQLKEQLKGDLLDRGYIGLYLKLSEYQCAAFEGWLADASEQFRGMVFGHYLDLVWLEALAHTLADLVSARVIPTPPSEEYAITRSISNDYPELAWGPGSSGQFTLKVLERTLYRMRRQLINLALARTRADPGQLAQWFPLGKEVGDFGRSVSAAIMSIGSRKAKKRLQWVFKICLDESECLSPFQQRVLNTHVRLAKAPLSFVVSYVRKIDMRSTLIPNLTADTPDRAIVLLDEMNDSEFTSFAEGVATVRVQKSLGDDTARFDIQALLGELNINELLHGILRTSESEGARRLLALARDLSNMSFFSERPQEDPDGGPEQTSHPPIYQAYIIDRLRLEVPLPDSPRWARRAQDSAELRKRMVAAYLCICKELGHDVKYAYSEMLLQMSDNCVRDFLAQMNQLFLDSALPLSKFLGTKIGTDAQNAALKRASEMKKRNVFTSGVSSPPETDAVIDSLGILTAKLQTMIFRNRGLRLSECGVFVLGAGASGHNSAPMLRLLKEAAEAGYFKIIAATEDTFKFRMHCSLAAAYGFSYRGAYYQALLPLSELTSLTREKDRLERIKLIDRMCDRICEVNDTPGLFEGL